MGNVFHCSVDWRPSASGLVTLVATHLAVVDVNSLQLQFYVSLINIDEVQKNNCWTSEPCFATIGPIFSNCL